LREASRPQIGSDYDDMLQGTIWRREVEGHSIP
jgi:hypothetical protein